MADATGERQRGPHNAGVASSAARSVVASGFSARTITSSASNIPGACTPFGLIGLSLSVAMEALQENRVVGQGKGRIAQLLANPHVYEKLVELYQQWGPAGVLADNPANFAVDRATVTKVKLKTTAGPDGGVGSDVLVLKATGKTHKVTLAVRRAAARTALESAGLMWWTGGRIGDLSRTALGCFPWLPFRPIAQGGGNATR